MPYFQKSLEPQALVKASKARKLVRRGASECRAVISVCTWGGNQTARWISEYVAGVPYTLGRLTWGDCAEQLLLFTFLPNLPSAGFPMRSTCAALELSDTFLRKNHLNNLSIRQANVSKLESAVLGTGWHSPWQPEKTSKLYPVILTRKWRNLPKVGAFRTWNFL